MFQYDPQRNYPKLTESKAIIRFQDCDPLAHLNNAKYFDYFFNAREDQIIHQYNLPTAYFLEGFPVDMVIYGHQIAYLRSAVLSEWITIRTSVIYFDAETIIEEFYMLDEARTTLKTLLWTTSKCIDKTGKKSTFPEYIMNYLEKICYREANYPQVDFSQRIKVIKNSLKL